MNNPFVFTFFFNSFLYCLKILNVKVLHSLTSLYYLSIKILQYITFQRISNEIYFLISKDLFIGIYKTAYFES